MRRWIFAALLWWTPYAWSVMPSNPDSDPNFILLPDGSKLTDIKVNGTKLFLSQGTGEPWGPAQEAKYLALKLATQTDPDHAVQWVLMNLDNHQVLQRSYNAGRRIFGASVAKVFTAGALLDKQGGQLKAQQRQLMADMIVVSSNTAWVELQNQIGNGVPDAGRAGIQDFIARLGYQNTRGYAGTLNGVHGNELNAEELADYMSDIYHARFSGAELQWKLMHTGRTGVSRARKYIPKLVYVGGKTGTYDGPSVDPDTGRSKNPDGSDYIVNVRNHILAFVKNGHQYGVAVLARSKSEEMAALLAGGLYREL